MALVNKLKPDRSVTGLLPAFFTLASCAIVAVIFGREGVAPFVTIVFLGFTLFAFTAWRRTRNIGYLGSTTYLFLGTIALASARDSVFGFQTGDAYHVMEVVTLPAIAWLIYLMVTKKVKWRGREILELAAAPVEAVENGFTERPQPVGYLEYSREHILQFADFCRRNLIALPYFEDDRVFLAPVRMGKEYGFLFNVARDYHNDTWVCFDDLGNVTVNISRADYHEYQADFSFDQLCASLGALFVDFLELHRRGDAVRIMDRINSVRTGWFS
jgi:hypothetical protein